MKCAITGASGFVGSAIADCFRKQGWETLALGRKNAAAQGTFPFTLGGDPGAIPWREIDAIVHCAHDFRLTRWEEIRRVNVEGSIRLLRAAKEGGVGRGVFISSVSAFEGCKSLYGKAKMLVEAEALELGYAVVRPGLVYGPDCGGMMGALVRVTRMSPVLPMIGDGAYPQYLVHQDDLARLVCLLCQKGAPCPNRAISAAHPEKIPLRELLQRIASRTDRRLRFVGVPWPLVLAGAKLLELVRLPSPFRSDSLIGIVFQNPNPDFYRECPFRPFE